MRKNEDEMKRSFIASHIALGVNYTVTIKPNCNKNKSVDDMISLANYFLHWLNRGLLGQRFNKKKDQQPIGFYTIEGGPKNRHLHFAVAVPPELVEKFTLVMPPPPPTPTPPDNKIVRLVRKKYVSANIHCTPAAYNNGSAEKWIEYCLKTINNVEDFERACSF
jgi:hypothetical protein